jgi:hypothetical protein
MLVPSPAVQVVDEEMCWKRKYYFKPTPDKAYYHTLLTKVLDDYYLDLHASIKYQCVEYQHPLEGTYWKVDLAVCAWNDIKNAHEISGGGLGRARYGRRHTSAPPCAPSNCWLLPVLCSIVN